MFDIVSVGHATIDFFLELNPGSAPLVWSEERRDNFVCLDYDDKTAVNDINWALGGNAVNSGVGLSRLGVKVMLLTEVGRDEWGRLIREWVSKESIDLQYLRENPGQKTDLSIILTLGGERTILSYHHPREYGFPEDLPLSRWVYLTSLGEKFESFHRKLLGWLAGRDVQLAFNPGTYELKAGLKRNRAVIEKASVLLVNREEAGELLGRRADKTDENLIRELRDLGPEVVVITDGAKGAFAGDEAEFYYQKAAPARLVEKTGAGDAFAAGFLAALIKECGISDALRWGVINSASVIERVGSIDGLLTLEELLAKLRTV